MSRKKFEGRFTDVVGEEHVFVEYTITEGGSYYKKSFKTVMGMDSPPEPPTIDITVTRMDDRREIGHKLTDEEIKRLERHAFNDAEKRLQASKEAYRDDK